MIQKNTYLKVVDNSGVKEVSCIHLYGGYRKRHAVAGDVILVAVKSLRKKRINKLKIKKGDVLRALVVKTKTPMHSYSHEFVTFSENNVVLFNSKKKDSNKYAFTRIFTSLPKQFRETRFLKILSICYGVVK
jgi:large subunit ribosomal protein L14